MHFAPFKVLPCFAISSLFFPIDYEMTDLHFVFYIDIADWVSRSCACQCSNCVSNTICYCSDKMLVLFSKLIVCFSFNWIPSIVTSFYNAKFYQLNRSQDQLITIKMLTAITISNLPHQQNFIHKFFWGREINAKSRTFSNMKYILYQTILREAPESSPTNWVFSLSFFVCAFINKIIVENSTLR